MMVRVRLFAVARELAGSDLVELEVPEPATVADVKRALVAEVPALEGVVAQSLLAIDGRSADNDGSVPARSEVALIPPVSGG